MGVWSRLFGRSDVSEQEVFDAPFEGDSREAEKIINAYGLVMMKRVEMQKAQEDVLVSFAMSRVAPTSMLHHSKNQIKEAIKLFFAECGNIGNTYDDLIMGYQRLAQYIPDEEAKKVFAGTAAISNPNHSGCQYTDYADEIQKKVKREEAKFLRELHAYLSELHSRDEIEYTKRQIESILKVMEGKIE